MTYLELVNDVLIRLRESSVTTVANTSSYSMTGAGQKFQVNDAINTTSDVGLQNISFVRMNRNLNFATPATGVPAEYAFNGVDGSGDTKVDLYAIPDGVYTIMFDLAVPQAALSSDSTSVKVLDYLVAQSAYARSLIERGEDGGTASSEAYALFRGMLSDAIALESTRYEENYFVPV